VIQVGLGIGTYPKPKAHSLGILDHCLGVEMVRELVVSLNRLSLFMSVKLRFKLNEGVTSPPALIGESQQRRVPS
jgi:hypothetical protein